MTFQLEPNLPLAPIFINPDFSKRFKKHALIIKTLMYQGYHTKEGWMLGSSEKYKEFDIIFLDEDLLMLAYSMGEWNMK